MTGEAKFKQWLEDASVEELFENLTSSSKETLAENYLNQEDLSDITYDELFDSDDKTIGRTIIRNWEKYRDKNVIDFADQSDFKKEFEDDEEDEDETDGDE